MSEVGILVNPAAARDVRRLISGATSVPLSERSARVQRVLTGLGAIGVARVWMMFDRAGIAGGLVQASKRATGWPEICFLDMPVEGESFDTQLAVRCMREVGVKCVVVLGGDGTHRLVSHECGSLPLVCLSTGTNNAFPKFQEETVAGLVAGAVANSLVDSQIVCQRNKRLRCFVDGEETIAALVDICVAREPWVGTRALWRPENFAMLYLTFAEPGAIGLSSIGSLVTPVSREAEVGISIKFGPGRCVDAPIAPGLMRQVEIADVDPLILGERVRVPAIIGTLALDGEKEVTLCADQCVEIELGQDGPRSVNVAVAMAVIAQRGLLSDGPWDSAQEAV